VLTKSVQNRGCVRSVPRSQREGNELHLSLLHGAQRLSFKRTASDSPLVLGTQDIVASTAASQAPVAIVLGPLMKGLVAAAVGLPGRANPRFPRPPNAIILYRQKWHLDLSD